MSSAKSKSQARLRPALQWRPTSAPRASSRYDDIWFVSTSTGWGVNSNGDIQHTSDGGKTWRKQFHSADYLRCVGFANRTTGWVGTLGRENEPGHLYHTSDGGETWAEVANLPAVRPWWQR